MMQKLNFDLTEFSEILLKSSMSYQNMLFYYLQQNMLIRSRNPGSSEKNQWQRSATDRQSDYSRLHSPRVDSAYFQKPVFVFNFVLLNNYWKVILRKSAWKKLACISAIFNTVNVIKGQK